MCRQLLCVGAIHNLPHTHTHTHTNFLNAHATSMEQTCLRFWKEKTHAPMQTVWHIQTSHTLKKKKIFFYEGLQHFIIKSPQHCLPLSLFSLWPASSAIYLLYRPFPWEAEEPDSHCLLSQHALQLTAVVEVSDPCTRPRLLSNCQSPLTGAILYLYTGHKTMTAA